MSFRWEDQDPGDEDPGEFTEAWAKRWLEWTLAERLRPYVGTTPIHRDRLLRDEMIAWATEPLQRPIVLECVIGTEAGT